MSFRADFSASTISGSSTARRRLPTGGHLEQSDGTSWMGMYCLNMLAIALELAQENPAYEDIASKFFEHFVYIAHAMNNRGGEGIELWDERGWLLLRRAACCPMANALPQSSLDGRTDSAVRSGNSGAGDRRSFAGFQAAHAVVYRQSSGRPNHIQMQDSPRGTRRLLSLVNRDQHPKACCGTCWMNLNFSRHMVSGRISKFHKDNPYVMNVRGHDHRVDYEPAESSTGLFGGNSNWRGPIWMPINFLLIEALQKFHHFYGADLNVELPTGSGKQASLWDAAAEISRRLTRIFLRSADGTRPVFGGSRQFQNDPRWRDHIYFHEYFHGDNGAGIGASHQTGWTALIAKLIEQSGERA